MTTVNACGNGLSGSTGSGSYVGATGPTMSNVTIDNVNISGNTISTTNVNGDMVFLPNGNGQMLSGSSTEIFAQASNAYRAQIAANSRFGVLTIGSYVNSSGGLTTAFVKSRSTTIGSFVTVNNGDTIGTLGFYGDDGTQFKQACAIVGNVSGVPSTNIVPGQLLFQTANTSGTLTTALTISNAQVVTLANPLPAGSGGTGISSLGSGVATALGLAVVGNGSYGLGLTGDSTFNPGIAFGGGTTGITYTTQSANYSRVGNMVIFSARITLSNKGSSTGTVTITGFPLALRSLTNVVAVFDIAASNLTYSGQAKVLMTAGTTTVGIYNMASAAASLVQLTDAAFTNTTDLFISGSYLV